MIERLSGAINVVLVFDKFSPIALKISFPSIKTLLTLKLIRYHKIVLLFPRCLQRSQPAATAAN